MASRLIEQKSLDLDRTPAPRFTAVKQPEPWKATVGALSARQVNALLALSTFGAVLTGLTSWAVGVGWSRWWTLAHACCGVSILVITPYKSRRSVAPGFRRRRATRWISAAFGLLMLAIVGTGLAHSTGLWSGVGYWTSLWTHFLFAFMAVPLLVWHMWARPSRLRRVDLNRRAFLGSGVVAGTSLVAVAGLEQAVRLAGLSGADRRFTGSHEVGSFDPALMPATVWIDDQSPRVAAKDWQLDIGGKDMPLEKLWADSAPVEATLDCTGGWFSTQRWDCVALADLVPNDRASFVVTSITGYRRVFPMRDAANVYLAVGYGGDPLLRRHGGPIRLVAPGRRGPWWIKWVSSVEVVDRPWWLQLPFPAT